MSGLRVSQIVVQLVLLDEYDAPKTAKPITFEGDADGTAKDKLAALISQLDEQLDAVAAQPVTGMDS